MNWFKEFLLSFKGFLFLVAIMVSMIMFLKNINDAETINAAKREKAAYDKVLHRIWIDCPNYFEDGLMESPEFIELSEISDFGDTFKFCTMEEHKEYRDNWENEIDHLPIQPNASPKMNIPDKIEIQ